jgi:hypothetical protein
MDKAKLLISLFLVMLSGAVVFATFNTESVVSEENNLPAAYIYERLVPNTMYMEWCDTISSNLISDDLCITPHGSKSEFVTDDTGTAIISLEAGAFQLQDNSTYFEVAISRRGIESPTWFVLSPTRDNLVDDDQATLKLALEGLVPDADYTLWCVAITHSLKSEINEQPCS